MVKEGNDEKYLMLEANHYQRTLRGVGGKRYFDIPGVIYPKETINARPGYSEETGAPYPSPPSWGVTTKDAAQILGNGLTATRSLLRRRKVRFQWVSRVGGAPIVYWNKKRVESIAEERLPMLKTRTESRRLLSITEAAEMAKVGRSTILRAVHAKKLPVIVARFSATPMGARTRSFFKRADVRKWMNQRRAMELRALHKKLREINSEKESS